MVIPGYPWLLCVIYGYCVLCMVIHGYCVLSTIIHGYCVPSIIHRFPFVVTYQVTYQVEKINVCNLNSRLLGLSDGIF